MSLFQNMLRHDESLFKDTIALDFDYIPKILLYREKEQQHFATCIKPLLMDRNGRNLFVHGPPGIGKTAALKWVLRDLEEHEDQYDVDIVPIYVNCWQKNSTYKIVLEICDVLGYTLTHNKKTEELLAIIKEMLNKRSSVFVFDEIDKIDDHQFIYTIIEEIYKKSIFLITNYKEWYATLDERIKSRLTPEMMEFRPYSLDESRGILKQRRSFAFVENSWEDAAFEAIVKRCYDRRDIRSGLAMMKEAGELAEDEASRKIILKHAEKAIAKSDEMNIKKPEELEDESQEILKIIESNTGKRIGDLFKIYTDLGGQSVYKTFQRRIAKLETGKFISVEKISGGSEGTTTIVHYQKKQKEKTLADF